MSTLIFGGAGFIGTNLVENILNQNSKSIVVFDNLTYGDNLRFLERKPKLIVGDMTKEAEVVDALRKVNPTTIYHLAANSDILASSKNPKTDVDHTLITTATLADAIRHLRIKPKLFFASTSAVYGESDEALSEESETHPISSYGWMKLASERILERLNEEGFTTKTLIARFPNVTGRYQTHGVIHDLVRRLKSNPESLTVLGDGTQSKPYALASELCFEFSRVLEGDWTGTRVYNFSPRDETSVKEIVANILDVSGLNPQVHFGNSKVGWRGDVNRYVLDSTKVQTDFGVLKFSTSIESIKEAIRWAWKNLEE